MNWVVLGGSLAAVLALAAIAWVLKLGRGGAIDDAGQAVDAVEEALTGFVATGAIVADDFRAALVAGQGGRLAVVKAHGARLAVREVAWSGVRATAGGMLIETGERLFGTVRLSGVDALDVRRMAPGLTRV